MCHKLKLQCDKAHKRKTFSVWGVQESPPSFKLVIEEWVKSEERFGSML